MNRILPKQDEDWVEIEGSSREDVLERACVALNTSRRHLEVEHLNGPGFKIRARKIEGQNFSDRSTTESRGRSSGAKRPTRPQNEDDFDDHEESEDGDSVREDRFNVRPPRSQYQNNRGPRAGGGRDRDHRGDRSESREDRGERQPRKEPKPENVEPDTRDYEKLAQEGHDILKEILKHISHETEIFMDHTDEEIVLEIEADGSGLYIGKHGQMLEALQHLVAKMLGLDRSSSKRLIVDSEGYRARRQMSLEVLAKKMAMKAKKNQRPVTLEPMTAMDRRVIHLALSDDRQISTKSVGEGSERKIVIVPKREFGGRGRGERGRGRHDRGGERGGREFGGRGRNDRGPIKSNRLHDSYDVPAEPKLDIFPENIDELMDGNVYRGPDSFEFETEEAPPRRESAGKREGSRSSAVKKDRSEREDVRERAPRVASEATAPAVPLRRGAKGSPGTAGAKKVQPSRRSEEE